jgi:aminoglycoside phosphotransferase (APT) family kinase protein
VSQPPWTPEIEVTADLAAELIGAQFPVLSQAGIAPIDIGWDNTVYLVGGEWVFRFPRRQVAVATIVREIGALPRLAPLLPLPVPVPEFAGAASDRYPWPFWGARLLPGTELAEAGLADRERGPAARALGNFPRVLHDPALAGRPGVTLAADPNGRCDVAARARLAGEIIARLIRDRIWGPDSGLLDLLGQAERAVPPSVPDPPAVLCHGDLHVRHLLIGSGGLASGVIDWGDMCLADPALDLSLAYSGFAGQPRAELLAAYGGGPDPRRELTARVLAIFLSAMLAEYARAQNRPGLLSESLAGLGRAVSD